MFPGVKELLPRSRPHEIETLPANFTRGILLASSPKGGTMGAAVSIHRICKNFGRALFATATIIIVGLGVAPASAQKNKKDLPPQPTILSNSQTSLLNLPDDRMIDNQISEMLGAWQVGDADKMHTYYADDVLVVSGGPEPPISGWANYLTAYQTQRAHMRSVRLDRTNTYTKVSGNSAWSTYDWVFTGVVDGTPMSARGHTTLALEKRDGRWLIVLNHTSVATQGPAAPAPKTGTP